MLVCGTHVSPEKKYELINSTDGVAPGRVAGVLLLLMAGDGHDGFRFLVGVSEGIVPLQYWSESSGYMCMHVHSPLEVLVCTEGSYSSGSSMVSEVSS